MIVAICSGTLAGLALFAIQRFTVIPLIEEAERYEHGEDHHHAEEWKPAPGAESAIWTAVTTVVTGIGFGALLFGFIHLTGRECTMRQGVLWGLAAYACVHVAPAFGLPPMPPGVPLADVEQRQMWWFSTVVAATAGLWLLCGEGWLRRAAGAICIAVPYIIGAPAASGVSEVPAGLIRNFVIASLCSTACFWIVLGCAGGYFSTRTDRPITR